MGIGKKIKERAAFVAQKTAWAMYAATHPVIGFAAFTFVGETVAKDRLFAGVVFVVYIIGLGCGVWQIDGEPNKEHQRKVMKHLVKVPEIDPAPANDETEEEVA